MFYDECDHAIYDDTRKAKEVKKKNFHPQTLMLVYCMMLMGIGYSGVERVLVILGLKHFSFATFLRYAIYITECSVDLTSGIMEKCLNIIFQRGEKSESGIADTAQF